MNLILALSTVLKKKSYCQFDTVRYRNCLKSTFHSALSADTASTRMGDTETKAKFIEQAMVASSIAARKQSKIEVQTSNIDNEIRSLIRQRRALPRDDVAAKNILCKKIQNLLRKKRRQTQTRKINELLLNFKGLNRMAIIKASGRKSEIPKLLGDDGTYVSSGQDIADSFARFY